MAGEEVPQGLTEALVYLSQVHVHDYQPKVEYIQRMNNGIADAVKLGVEAEYVQTVMRRFIPDASLSKR